MLFSWSFGCLISFVFSFLSKVGSLLITIVVFLLGQFVTERERERERERGFLVMKHHPQHIYRNRKQKQKHGTLDILYYNYYNYYIIKLLSFTVQLWWNNELFFYRFYFLFFLIFVCFVFYTFMVFFFLWFFSFNEFFLFNLVY